MLVSHLLSTESEGQGEVAMEDDREARDERREEEV